MRVMTWNLWWRFGPFEQRLPAIIDTIRSVDPDIVCVQEVWSREVQSREVQSREVQSGEVQSGEVESGEVQSREVQSREVESGEDCDDGDDRRDVADELAAALGMHVVRTDPMMWNGESFGNAVLARWPVERIASLPLPDAAGEPGYRRIAAASVATPWGAWPIASTHLDHRYDGSATRQSQVRRLLELGLEWRGDPASDLPLIVGADLNAVPDSDEVRLLTGRSAGVDGIVFSDVWEQVGNGPGHTWRAENPYLPDSAWPNRRIDSLLVSWPRPNPVGNPTRVWNVGTGPVDVTEAGGAVVSVWPSDHAAVVADFVTP